ncbi:hypothetical protein AB3A67_004959 [Pseudomonas aeruginosa]
MIDPADKQTQALPLEQPKRGRGRPATGKALSDAERARRYRANKKKRDDQTSRKEAPSIPADGVKEILDGWQRTQPVVEHALTILTTAFGKVDGIIINRRRFEVPSKVLQTIARYRSAF